MLGQIQLEISFSFNTCIYLTVGQNFLFLNVPLLPQQSEDISCCVEGSKDANTESWEPQHRDTLNNRERLLPWTQTVRQEGHYNGYSQMGKMLLWIETVRKEGCHHRLPNNNTVTMEAVTKKAVTVDTVEEKDCLFSWM